MVEENEQLPDWLVELRDQQIAEQTGERDAEPMAPLQPEPGAPEEPPPAKEEFPEPPIYAEEEIVEEQTELEEPPESVDALDSLREQMILAEEDFEAEERSAGLSTFMQSITALKPTQRLVLAIMLFLEVAIGGFVLLLVMGRVALPF